MKISCEPKDTNAYRCEITKLTEAETARKFLPPFNHFAVPRENVVSIGIVSPGLSRIPADIFTTLQNLQSLSIESQIKEIFPEDFANAPKNGLILDLPSNEIAKLSVSTFKGVNLTYLNLYENKIEIIEDFTFFKQNFLRTLRLPSNRLTNIKKNTFAGLYRLYSLNLSNNEIETIDEGAFRLPSLRILRLHGNKIKLLNASMFDGAVELFRIQIDVDDIECQKLKDLHPFMNIDFPIC